MAVINHLQITNLESVSKKDVAVSILSFKSFPPNIFFFVYNISSPVPYEIIKGENDFIKFKIKELKPGETLDINLTYTGMLWGADYFSHLDVNKISGDYDAAFLEKFTQAAAGIEVEDSQIKELARKIVGEEKNPFWKAYKIYNWITRNIIYDYEKAERENLETGALLTLRTKKGTCDDYTKLFVALARASGIPARSVMLYVMEGKANGHGFPEVYLPPYGWIPLDPTWGTILEEFARTEPGLFILAKEDGLTDNYQWKSLLEGAEAQGISVSSSLIGGLLIRGKETWNDLSADHFFLDIYQLTSLYEINDQLSFLEKYNQGMGQQLFTVVEKPRTSVVVTVQRALEAYLHNNYPAVRAEVQKVIAEQLQFASSSFSLLMPKIQEYVESPYSSRSMILHGTITINGEQQKNPTPTEVLLQINQTKKEMDLVQEQARAGDYYNAVKTMIDSFYSTSGVYPNLMSEAAMSAIQNTIYTVKNMLRFDLGRMILIFVVMVIMPILWIWMSINCLVKKEFRHLNKIVWFLIVFLICLPIPIGAIIYFFVEFIWRKKPISDNIKNNKIVIKRKDNSR